MFHDIVVWATWRSGRYSTLNSGLFAVEVLYDQAFYGCTGRKYPLQRSPSRYNENPQFSVILEVPVGDEYLHSDRVQFVPLRLLMRYEVL